MADLVNFLDYIGEPGIKATPRKRLGVCVLLFILGYSAYSGLLHEERVLEGYPLLIVSYLASSKDITDIVFN